MIPLLRDKTTTETLTGGLALTLANAAGLIHMVVLPFWVASLMMTFKFGPDEAGLMVTLYILGMLVSSAAVGPRFNAIEPPLWAAGGFAFGALMFLACLQDPSPWALGGFHALAGLGVGVALSCVSGIIGRSANPHGLFAKANVGFATISFGALSITPAVIETWGANGMFAFMGLFMAVALATSLVALPMPPPLPAAPVQHGAAPAPPRADHVSVWLALTGIGLLTTSHALVWSFADRLADFRGFERGHVKMVFAAAGIACIGIPILAGAFQRKWPAQWVCAVTGGAYGLVAAALAVQGGLPFYAVALCVLISLILMAQIFAFGLIAHLDPTGKASATLPAVLMAGAAAGPFLGGVVARLLGYPALGFASLALCAAGAGFFALLIRRMASPAPAVAAAAAPIAASAPPPGAAPAAPPGTPRAG